MTMKLIPLKLLVNSGESISFFEKKSKHDQVALARSVLKDGLLNPLVVVKRGGSFLVLDGKKRLAIIQRLAKAKHLSKRMAKVPCVIQETQTLAPLNNRRPALLSGPELAHEILINAQAFESHAAIAQRFDCDISVVEDCLSLKRLHPELLMFFNKGTVSLEQAAALATIENMTAQLDLLKQLGPFVSDTEIIAQIKAGATVVQLTEENIIFLPSRARSHPKNGRRAPRFGEISKLSIKQSESIAA